MFAPRTNNENAIYERQKALTAKPLNTDVKSLAPKTPAINKPYKANLRTDRGDENTIRVNPGKAAIKTEDAKIPEQKSNVKQALLTPGQTTRAPLGNKTTNKKIGNLQGLHTTTSARTHKSKLKIHQPEPSQLESDDEEPEIEFMAPRGEPLPDYPDDWPHDRQYPQFEGLNLTRGWLLAGLPQCDEDEDPRLPDLGKIMRDTRMRNERAKHEATELSKSRAAVVALSKPSYEAARKSTVAENKRSQHPGPSTKGFSAGTSGRALEKGRMPQTADSRRYPIAKAASNTTLGYTKGRAVSSGVLARGPASRLEAVTQLDQSRNLPLNHSSVFDEWLKSSTTKSHGEPSDDTVLDVEVDRVEDEDDEFYREFQLQLT